MKPIKKEVDGKVSAAATPNDTRLNLLVLFEKKGDKYRDDTMRVLSHLKGFRYSAAGRFVRKGKFYLGLYLNMRELARALDIGSAKTVRVKSVGVQTDDDDSRGDVSPSVFKDVDPSIFNNVDMTQTVGSLPETIFDSDNFVPNTPGF